MGKIRELKSWQVVFETLPFFVSNMYFIANVILYDQFKDAECNRPMDEIWVWVSIGFCGLSMALVFRAEDLYLLPTALYEDGETKVKSLVEIDIFQDEADDRLIV